MNGKCHQISTTNPTHFWSLELVHISHVKHFLHSHSKRRSTTFHLVLSGPVPLWRTQSFGNFQTVLSCSKLIVVFTFTLRFVFSTWWFQRHVVATTFDRVWTLFLRFRQTEFKTQTSWSCRCWVFLQMEMESLMRSELPKETEVCIWKIQKNVSFLCRFCNRHIWHVRWHFRETSGTGIEKKSNAVKRLHDSETTT